MHARLKVEWISRPRPDGPVTCAVCGCRLTPAEEAHGVWVHFKIVPGRDARGCRPRCLEELHGKDGRALTGEMAITAELDAERDAAAA